MAADQTDTSSKGSLWARIKDNIGFISSVIGIVTFAAGFVGWEAGTGRAEQRVDDVVALSDDRLAEAIAALPEGQRASLEPLVTAIQDLLKAPAAGASRDKAVSGVEDAVNKIADFSRLITVKTYTATHSPFTLPVGETLMLCDSTVSVGLPRLTHNNTRALAVISGKQLSLTPGTRATAGPGGAAVTLLDILGETNEAVFAFTCG